MFVFVAWIAVKLSVGETSRERFGLVRPQGVLNVLRWMAAAYAIFWVAAILLTAIFGQPDEQTLVNDLKNEDTLGVVIVWGVLICFLAPIVEEFFFRGFMFTVLARRMGVVVGRDRRRHRVRDRARRGRRDRSSCSRSRPSEWGCASSIGAHSPSFRAWRFMHSTIRSRSA